MSRSRGNAEGRDPKTPLRPGAAEARRSDPRSSPTEVISQQCPHMVKKLNWLQVFGGAEPPQSLDMERYGKIHSPEALTNGKRTRQGLWRTQGGRPIRWAEAGATPAARASPRRWFPPGSVACLGVHHARGNDATQGNQGGGARSNMGASPGGGRTKGSGRSKTLGNAPPMYLEQDRT